MERSAVGVRVSVSVAELLPGVGSVAPPGAVTVAVFTRVPVAPGATVALTVNVAIPPTGRLTVAPMSPLPEAEPHEPPAEPTLGKLTPGGSAGIVSVTVSPVTELGPAFEATIV